MGGYQIMVNKNTDSVLMEKVTSLLAGYRDSKQRARQLAFELASSKPIASHDDVIDVMTFGKAPDAGVTHVKSYTITDKTANTAIDYMKSTVVLNSTERRELEHELRNITMELMRLEYYIELLGGRLTRVLKLLYVDGLTYMQTMKELCISISTMKRLRKEGIIKLTEMYKSIAGNMPF
jgi:DNA-directed RNA polymerase specialized sigma24 family protein